MPALSEYSNVYNTVILILHEKGYQVWADEKTGLYCAEKNGWDFMADTPCGLLGLVAVFEFKRPKQWSEYWWRLEGPSVYETLPSKPTKQYTSVVVKQRRVAR